MSLTHLQLVHHRIIDKQSYFGIDTASLDEKINQVPVRNGTTGSHTEGASFIVTVAQDNLSTCHLINLILCEKK